MFLTANTGSVAGREKSLSTGIEPPVSLSCSK